ncbi:GerW family sporulation protein [Pasteuria penetrans]|uniref:GerW family sporulation protein n=1 Tax=Pasteuria penetrans TaxID=86005 RepID=UPI000F94281C|nr:GerW family sporulation protein [Pasteuria penetrans]
MGQHPIQGLMETAMESIREMVDVNTIIGDSVETPDGQTIIPVSRVGFGFAAGGSEFSACSMQDAKGAMVRKGGDGGIPTHGDVPKDYPFGGGSGGGVSITPVAFLVVNSGGQVQLLNLKGGHHLYDRLIEMTPSLLDKVKNAMQKNGSESADGGTQSNNGG